MSGFVDSCIDRFCRRSDVARAGIAQNTLMTRDGDFLENTPTGGGLDQDGGGQDREGGVDFEVLRALIDRLRPILEELADDPS